MKLIEYNSYNGAFKNASSKAKNDVSEILKRKGYSKLYTPSKRRIIRIFQQIVAILTFSKESVFFIQYPSHKNFFYKIISSYKKVKKIALLHDVESLRGTMDVTVESKILNKFDVLIGHNAFMTKYLRSSGVVKPIIEINIFDYLLNTQNELKASFDMYSIFFAGNLVKSGFLSKLSRLGRLHFNIYGASFFGIESIMNQSNVSYKGAFTPEDLISKTEGGWGLIWDGDSLDTCSGVFGEYLKYNNPHKVSMCIVSERPVIIWSKAAMATYIKEKGLGICVDSLFEVYDRIKEISEWEYNKMLTRVKKEKQRLIDGQNFIECLTKCERKLNIERYNEKL